MSRAHATHIGGLPILTPTEKASLNRAFTAAVLGYSVLNIPQHLPRLPQWFWAYTTAKATTYLNPRYLKAYQPT